MNAITTYSAGGGRRYRIGFPYLEILDAHPTHVEVRVDAVLQVLGTDYEIAQQNAAEIFFINDPAPAKGATIIITRITPHPVSGTGLLFQFLEGVQQPAKQLNNALNQCIYYAEEVEDIVNG